MDASSPASLAQCKGLKAGRDLKLLGKFDHPAPGLAIPKDAAQDHRRIAVLQRHLEQGPADR